MKKSMMKDVWWRVLLFNASIRFFFHIKQGGIQAGSLLYYSIRSETSLLPHTSLCWSVRLSVIIGEFLFHAPIGYLNILLKTKYPYSQLFWRQIQYGECCLQTRHPHDITTTRKLTHKHRTFGTVVERI